MERVEKVRLWISKRQKTLASIAICVMAVFLAYHVFTANNGIKIYFQKRAENRTLKNEIEQLKLENEQLSKRVNALRSDPQTIEKEAREQLKYAKPGEIVYVNPEPPRAKPPATATAQKK